MSDYQFNPNQEQWKEIIDFPGYEVSDHGQVRSFWQFKGTKIGHIIGNKPRILRQSNRANRGYLYVILTKNKIHYPIRVSPLVLTTFIGPCPPGMESCHNDGNSTNNILTNLRWDTHASNIMDKFKHGTMPKGETHGMSKLTEKQITEIRQFYDQKRFSQRDLANLFNMCQASIWYIIHKKTWAHI